MKWINDYKQMQYALNQFMINNATRLPDHSTEHWLDISIIGNPLQKLLAAAEMLYAVKAELNDPGRTVVAQMFSILAADDLLGVNREGRAQKIISAMRRDLDEPPPPFGWPDEQADPLPLATYLEPEEVVLED